MADMADVADVAWTGRRGRWLGRRLSGCVALLGVLLVVPSLLAPTWEMSVADREHGSLLSRQWEWSWGRVRVTGLEGVELRDQWNVLGLAVLVLLLAAALVGVVVWFFPRVAWGRTMGLVTIGLLAGRVLTTVGDRVGRSLGELDRGASGLTVRTKMTSAGSLETAAALVLLLAIVLLALAAVRPVDRDVVGRPDAPRRPGTPGTDSAAPTRPGRSAGLRPAGEHLSAAPVSFGAVDGTGSADSAPGAHAKGRAQRHTPAEPGGTGAGP